jgi:carbonic anhydrase
MIFKGEVGIIGAVYDVETGVVNFLEDTLIIGSESLHTQNVAVEG